MKFTQALQTGLLIKRYKRFLTDVERQDGSLLTIHCANTGAMTGCAEPGSRVYFSQSDNPKRKYAHSWELSYTAAGHWIGINTHRANALVEEAIKAAIIPELQGYAELQREVKYGDENSRIDILLSRGDQRCYVEVKSVTLLQGESGQGFFPDTKSTRGQKHIRELMQMVQQGHRAVLFFCVQHTGIRTVAAAAHIDPTYAQLLTEAQTLGVEVMAYGCSIDAQSITLTQPLAFNAFCDAPT